MIKRTLFTQLQNHLEKPEITLLTGPRQAGKTTLLRQLETDLHKQGKTSLFLNLDIEDDRRHVFSQRALLDKVALNAAGHTYVFIDEIQRKTDAGVFLKGLFDMNLPYKFIISGSGSLELKEKIHESLAGRKQVFELSIVTFLEFVNFKTDYQYENRLSDFFAVEQPQTMSLLSEYLTFGGYPKVILAQTELEKRAVIAELYESYLEKDIKSLLNIKKTDDFTHLLRLMAAQIGNLTSVSELSNTIGVAQETIKNYLWYMEKTFVLMRVTPFFRNIRKEITKMPIFYFSDMGLRNYAYGHFGNPADQTAGFVFENFIFAILTERLTQTGWQLHFWRTKDKAEVDFVIDKGHEIIPLEVKYSNIKTASLSRSFRSFLEKYQPKRALVVHTGQPFEDQVGTTHIEFLPFSNLFSVEL